MSIEGFHFGASDFANVPHRKVGGTDDYQTARNDFIKRYENDKLKTGAAVDPDNDHTKIHDDGEDLPTIGYGLNLANAALSYEQIEYLLTQAYEGTLSSAQDDALIILKLWKEGTSFLAMDANAIVSNYTLTKNGVRPDLLTY